MSRGPREERMRGPFEDRARGRLEGLVRRARGRAPGFTLVELLVAMAIVAIIGVMALAGLNSVIKQREIAKERSARWREIQFAMRIVEQDLTQIEPRPTRDESGESYRPCVLANPNAQFALEFSRGGWSNPAGFKRGTVLRVAYDWEDDKLVRFYWPVMDRTLATPPVKTELLTGVEDVQIRFLDAGGQWQLEWPPVGASGPDQLVSRPRAVELSVDLKDFGKITRLVETSS
ncbi:MAG TPA: type II secretion system minor pseudopilin GspJ [Gammaproteobacteria bacterium]|nr:type II secretion system minor pseudopilin GspJ [Gammaproteobacteria bacterium]